MSVAIFLGTFSTVFKGIPKYLLQNKVVARKNCASFIIANITNNYKFV